MIIALALFAALLLGVGFVLQHRAASRAPKGDMLRPRLIWHLAHSPQWLCGIAAMVAGQVLSALALARSAVTVVEPLLAANLLVALLLAGVLARRRLLLSDWVGCLVLGLGLAGFIIAGNPAANAAPVGGLRRWGAVAGIAAVGLGLVAASRVRPLQQQATMLAAAAGVLAGLQDGFTRSSMITLEADVSAVLRIWQPYAVVCVALVVILLQQSAFEAAALRHTLPAITVGEPLSGIAFGIIAFGDHLRTAPWALAVEALGLVGMVVGVYVLATSALLSHALGEHHRAKPAGAGSRGHHR